MGRLGANVVHNGILLRWEFDDNIPMYSVHRDGKLIHKSEYNHKKFLDADVQPGRTYRYMVDASPDHNQEVVWNMCDRASATVKVPSDFTPTQQTVKGGNIVEVVAERDGGKHVILSISPKLEGVYISWDSGNHELVYNVYREDLATGNTETLADSVRSQSYTDIDVKPGEKYKYMVLGFPKGSPDSNARLQIDTPFSVSADIKIPRNYKPIPQLHVYAYQNKYFGNPKHIVVSWYGAGGDVSILRYSGPDKNNMVVSGGTTVARGGRWVDENPVPGYNKYVISRPYGTGTLKKEVLEEFRPPADKNNGMLALLISAILLILILLIVLVRR